MMTRLLFVRHGATVLSKGVLSGGDRYAGSTDVPLGDDGRAQVRHLARRLSSEALDAVYCSPLRRTAETAAMLAEPHRLTPGLVAGLREIDHGRWEGLTRQEVEARFPDEYAAWERDPLHVAPTGGDTGEAVLARALSALNAIVVGHTGQRVLVVSHKGTIRLLVARLLGIDARGYRDRLEQLPACLNVVDVDSAGQGRLVLFNDISHYACEPPS